MNDPLITEDHIKLLQIADDGEIEKLKEAATEINEVLVNLMDTMNLRLADFTIKFGRTNKGHISQDEDALMKVKFYWLMKFLQIHVEFGINKVIQILIKMFIEKIQDQLSRHIKLF